MLTSRPPPLPGARRPAHAQADLRRPRRPEARLRRRRQQRRALAGDHRRPRRRRGQHRRPRRLPARAGGRRPAHRRPLRGREGRQRRLHRRLGEHERLSRDRRGPHARRCAPTSSTTSCSPPPRPARSRCTACQPTRARRSPSRCSTGSASASGIRRRTAATPRRRCWNCSALSLRRSSPLLRAPHRSAPSTLTMTMDQTSSATTRPHRGDQLELTVDTLAFGGAGVARHDGYVVFVQGGDPRRHGAGRGRQGKARLRRGARARGRHAQPRPDRAARRPSRARRGR